jgi:starch-binding outer membrane protein, SusD/RagB family
MKKNLYILGIATVITFATSACGSFLDVPPLDRNPDPDFLKKTNNVESILTQGYNLTFASSFVGGETVKAAELYGDNINFIRATGAAEREFVSQTFGIFNDVARNNWNTAYKGIYHANIAIDATENNTYPADAAIKNRILGEALALRALAHFELLRLFGLPFTASPTTNPGIPIRDKFLPTPELAAVRTPRSRVSEVYDFIIKDLQRAISLLPETNGNGKINRWVAKAVLARVYFNKEDYANARTQADEVIKSNRFKMPAPSENAVTVPFMASGDVPVADGVVFQIISTGSDDVSGSLRGTFWSQNPGAVPLPISNALNDELRVRGGTRFTKFVTQAAEPFCTKYVQAGNGAVNIPYIRLAEMYLIRAEGAAVGGDVTGARADLNAVRRVAQATEDNATSDAAALRRLIQTERRVEFFCEGDRWHELRRLKSTNIRNSVGFDNKKGLMKIPDTETRVWGNAYEQN